MVTGEEIINLLEVLVLPHPRGEEIGRQGFLALKGFADGAVKALSTIFSAAISVNHKTILSHLGYYLKAGWSICFGIISR